MTPALPTSLVPSPPLFAGVRSLVCHLLFISPDCAVVRRRASLAVVRTLFRGSCRSLPLFLVTFPPPAPPTRVSLRHETRLPSERNQSSCTKRCATPRAMRKRENAGARATRVKHSRSPHLRARHCIAQPWDIHSTVYVDGVSTDTRQLLSSSFTSTNRCFLCPTTTPMSALFYCMSVLISCLSRCSCTDCNYNNIQCRRSFMQT